MHLYYLFVCFREFRCIMCRYLLQIYTETLHSVWLLPVSFFRGSEIHIVLNERDGSDEKVKYFCTIRGKSLASWEKRRRTQGRHHRSSLTVRCAPDRRVSISPGDTFQRKLWWGARQNKVLLKVTWHRTNVPFVTVQTFSLFTCERNYACMNSSVYGTQCW